MSLLATVDFVHVAAATVIPIAWGAAMHWLFGVWGNRRATPVVPPSDPVAEEADEANLP